MTVNAVIPYYATLSWREAASPGKVVYFKSEGTTTFSALTQYKRKLLWPSTKTKTMKYSLYFIILKLISFWMWIAIGLSQMLRQYTYATINGKSKCLISFPWKDSITNSSCPVSPITREKTVFHVLLEVLFRKIFAGYVSTCCSYQDHHESRCWEV